MTSSINFLTLTSKPNLTGEGGGAEIHSKGPGKIGLKLLHNVTFIWFYFFQIYNISGLRFTPSHYITLSSSMTITPITTSIRVKLVGPKTCLKWGHELPFICLDFVQKTFFNNKNYFYGRSSTPFTNFLLLWLFNSSDSQRNIACERFKTGGFCSDRQAW